MSSDKIWFFSEDVNVSCCECGAETTLSPDFDEVAGDLRLNFVKVRSTIPSSGTCPQCGNEMEVGVTYWRREFYCKDKDGKEVCRYFNLWLNDNSSGCSVEGLASLFYFNLWLNDNSSGCSVEGLASLFETYALDHPDDLELDVSSAQELIGHLYGETRDEALLAVEKSLENGGSVESVIPELKRIIDSHDDVLKDAYLSQYPL